MRLDEDAVREVLADAWQRWARRCAEFTPQQWSTATRCRAWDVRGLVAHHNPDRSLFDMLNAATTDQPAALTDAAEMLRRFNAPGGIAHTSADGIAERATTDATKLTPAPL
jgi:mycothiol maleylpyruvate isomerase-like protein